MIPDYEKNYNHTIYSIKTEEKAYFDMTTLLETRKEQEGACKSACCIAGHAASAHQAKSSAINLWETARKNLGLTSNAADALFQGHSVNDLNCKEKAVFVLQELRDQRIKKGSDLGTKDVLLAKKKMFREFGGKAS